MEMKLDYSVISLDGSVIEIYTNEQMAMVIATALQRLIDDRMTDSHVRARVDSLRKSILDAQKGIVTSVEAK